MSLMFLHSILVTMDLIIFLKMRIMKMFGFHPEFKIGLLQRLRTQHLLHNGKKNMNFIIKREMILLIKL